MKHPEPIQIGAVCKQFLAQSPHQHKLAEATVIGAWQKIMHPAITQRTEQIYVKQHKLFLKISSAPLRQEIQHNKVKLLALIQELAPDYPLTDLAWL